MNRNTFLKRGEVRKPAHKRSEKQEKGLAQRINGVRISRSGAGDEKCDVRVKRLVRIEAKTTSKKSFSVSIDMLNKIENAALPCDEIPILVIEFLDERGKPIKECSIVPSYVLDLLVKAN